MQAEPAHATAASGSDVDFAPDINGERCVHALIGDASCRACADACPHDAIIIDDERLGIDVSRCDGCGLCLPACPQRAVEAETVPLPRIGRDGALIACDQVAPAGGAGVRRCVHSLGVRDILDLARMGVASVSVFCGDCKNCDRGRSSQRFEAALYAANALLASRGGATVEKRAVDKAGFERARAEIGEGLSEKGLSRRGLFTGLAKAARERLDDISSVDADPLMLLECDRDGALFLFHPIIDVERCTACGSCARICPHGALAFVRSRNVPMLAVDAARCTGCRMCIDICAEQAVVLEGLVPRRQSGLELVEMDCPACGRPFTRLRSQGVAPRETCPICAVNNPYSKLHQVIRDERN